MSNRKKDQKIKKNDSRGIAWHSSSWLGLGALIAEGRGSIPGQGATIPQAAQCCQKKRKKNDSGTCGIHSYIIEVPKGPQKMKES